MKDQYKVLLLGAVAIFMEWVFDIAPESLSESASAIAWLAPVLGAVSQAASGIAGTIMANKQQKKVDEAIDARERRLDALRDAEMNTSYLDRADSREMLRKVAQYNDEQMKALNTNAVKGGASEEAKIAAASQLNRNYADAIGSIASAGQRHRDMVQDQYWRGKENIENLRLQQLMDDSGTNALVSGLSGMGNVIAGMDFSTLGKTKPAPLTKAQHMKNVVMPTPTPLINDNSMTDAENILSEFKTLHR